MIQIDRFEDQIRALEQHPVETGKVLLYGSSFFAHWGVERAKKQWKEAAGLEVVNHGFGGAVVSELLYYYHRLVRPYQPSAMVFRTGHNDAWEYGPEEMLSHTKLLFDWVKSDFPGIRLIAIKPFDTPSALDENLQRIHRYNALLDGLSKDDPLLETVDINEFFQSADGSYRDVFLEDGLHLTDSGYEEMARYLASKIKALL